MPSTTSTQSIVAHATAKPHSFSQQSPRYTCRYARRYKDISEQKGYKIKCRDPRCSLECNGNWSYKHGLCLARHLQDNLPDGVVVLKGHLSLKKNATPEQHQAAKDAFLLSLRRWAKRHGHRVELHAVIHVTDPLNAHWDYHLWTDGPYHPLRDFFNQAWAKRHGHHSSIVEPDNLDGSARYQAKAVEPDSKSREILLPARQRDCGLDHQWSTRGFWCHTSIDRIWHQLIEEWKAGPITLSSEDYQAVRGCPECERARPKLCPLHQNKRDITDTPDSSLTPYQDARYIPGDNPSQDRQHFLKRLPVSIDQAIGLADYAQRWGVDPAYMAGILPAIPGAICTSGQILPNGNASYNGWYLKE